MMRLARIRRLGLAGALALGACGQPGSGSSPASGSAATSAPAPKPPSPETTLFAPTASLLADLPALKLIPKSAIAVVAVRDPAIALAKLATLTGFTDAKDPLAKEIDAAAKDITKDLPELAALAQNGVDLGKPIGVVWMDADFHTAALFAAVSDPAAMRRWMEERAKLSNGKRQILEGDALVLRAKEDVTRAVVMRKGHVFWLRSRDLSDAAPDLVIETAGALAKTEEGDSLAADPAFTGALRSLAFGSQAAAYLSSARFAEGVLAARTRDAEAAHKALDEAKAELADAEKKKRARAVELAKREVELAERRKVAADAAAREAAILPLVKEAVPGIAAGIELGDREIKLKAFVSVARPAAPASPAPGAPALALLPPLRLPAALFDPMLGSGTALHFALDPRLLSFLSDRFDLPRYHWTTFPIGRAHQALRGLGIEVSELAPLLDGELSTATHLQPVDALPADATADAGTAAREREGFTVLFGLDDPDRARALFEDAWKKPDTADRAAKDEVRRLADGSFEVGSPKADLRARVRIAGRALLVTTHPALAAVFDPSKPAPTWMAASDHPTLKQLAGIEQPAAIVAFDLVRPPPGARGERNDELRHALTPKVLASFDLASIGMGPELAKIRKLREQRDKIDEKLRDLRKALAEHQDATWRAFEARAGKAVLYATPAEGGIAVHGGLFTSEPSLAALVEAAIASYLAAGPRWERWAEMTDLKKKVRDLDDRIDAERRSSLDHLMQGVVGGVLGELGGPDDLPSRREKKKDR